MLHMGLKKDGIFQMKTLPDGKVIDLSTDRSKHQALRQTGVGPASTHRELYSLVDTIYRRIDESGKLKRDSTEYDYEFSGYTLDMVRLASDHKPMGSDSIDSWLRLL